MAADLAAVGRLGAAEHWLAVVATTRADGSVHASLVNAGILDHPVTGEPIDRVRRTRRRAQARPPAANRATRRSCSGAAGSGPRSTDRRASADRTTRWTVCRRRQLAGLLRDVFRAAGGTHDDWDEYDRVMADDRRAVVLVAPARITGNA